MRMMAGFIACVGLMLSLAAPQAESAVVRVNFDGTFAGQMGDVTGFANDPISGFFELNSDGSGRVSAMIENEPIPVSGPFTTVQFLNFVSNDFMRLDGNLDTVLNLTSTYALIFSALDAAFFGDGAITPADAVDRLLTASPSDLTGGILELNHDAAGNGASFNLTVTSIAAVPLPAALGFLLTGLGSLVVLRAARSA